MRLRKINGYSLFIFTLLVSEFYSIEFFGGALRLYHFLVPFVIIFLLYHLGRVIRTPLALALLLFLFFNGLAAALADNQVEAFRSLGLLTINMLISFAVGLIVISNRLILEDIVKIILMVGLLGTLWGIVQVGSFRLAGLNLSLSPSQAIQIEAGFSPGFRTEANTFAKSLNIAFLLLLPSLIWRQSARRASIIGVLLFAGMLSAFTRSAFYGLSLTLIVIYLWYLITGRGKALSPRALISLAIVGILVFIFSHIVGNYNEYAQYKIANFFNAVEILEGGSSTTRLAWQTAVWDAFLSTNGTLWFGNGWGQIYVFYQGVTWQAGGGELSLALGYAGLLGGFGYLLYQFIAIGSVHRATVSEVNPELAKIYEGVMFALIGCFITGQLNGAFIAPDYWMLFGLAIGISYKAKISKRAGAAARPGIFGRQYSGYTLRGL